VRSRLGLRSAYSFLYGTSLPAAIAARAREYGATGLAITDRNGLYGLHAVLEATREAGLRPLAGAELVGTAGSVFAFVLDRRGFSRLCKILSDLRRGAGQKDRAPSAPFPSAALLALLREDARGLALAGHDPDLLQALAGRVPRLYAALTPRTLRALPAARTLGLPLIALDDATFLDSPDRAAHAVLRAIALGKTVGTLAAADTADPEDLFLPSAAVERRLASWPEAIRAADDLVAENRFDRVFDGYVFPEYTGRGAQNPARTDPAELLRRRVYAGAERRYGELSDAILGRIEYELDIIERKGFSSYFLLMDDIVAMAARTCGRGSGAASIVSYALSITNVDPIAHKLYFERFLNLARPDPPDIDVDFPWDERDALIKAVIDRFGEDYCARVANHNFFRFRSALRETAKAYGFSEGEVSRLERRLIEQEDRTAGAEPVWTEILDLARRLEGLPRGLSMHCGGLVVCPAPVSRYAPTERSAEGYPLLAWEKDGTEAAGLVKLDLLGNRSLAVIRDALANLSETGIALDFDRVNPVEDAATVQALAAGDSLGVFYIESPAMRQLQKKTGRGDFDHIVIHSSIIRPAANRFIAEYVRRLKGGSWRPLHPRLETILAETYGILCYQEDVSKTAVALAGFDEVEADALRKIIAKKAGGERLAAFKQRFFTGCRTNGVAEETIDAVWAMMLSFDGYSFNKPHSASYAMVSFQSAYLRVHYPAPFMAAVLSNQGGYYRPQAYISEARRMGLAIVGPDINRSRYRYYGIPADAGTPGTVVVGLMAIADLSRPGAEALPAERDRHGAYTSLQDVSARIHLSRKDILALAKSGVFDGLEPGLSRPRQVRTLLRAAAERSGTKLLAFGSPADRKILAAEPDPVGYAPASAEMLKDEFESLGFLRHHHPLIFWSRRLAKAPRINAAALDAWVGRRVALVGWPITRKEVWTKDGMTMNFMSFEDETALYETVMFPEIYARYRHLLFDQVPFHIIGKVQNDQGALCVEVAGLRRLEEPHTGVFQVFA